MAVLPFAAAHVLSTILLALVPRQEVRAANQERLLSLRPGAVQALTLGHGRMVSSLAWIATMIQADMDHLPEGGGRSWMYHRFALIARLDPWFRHLYGDGGLYLSVVKDDVRGAKDLIELGLSRFPDDFWLNYLGAFNDLFELGLAQDAIAKYRRALAVAPPGRRGHLQILIAKAAAGSREPELAARVLESILPRVQDPRARRKVLESLRGLRRPAAAGARPQ